MKEKIISSELLISLLLFSVMQQPLAYILETMSHVSFSRCNANKVFWLIDLEVDFISTFGTGRE